MASRRRLRRLILAALTVSAGACSAIRFEPDGQPAADPEPEAPRVAGSWAGIWEIDGQRIDGTLDLRQNGSELQATFASRALGGDATGTGTVRADGQLRLELRYDISCAGTAQLSGEVLAGGRLAGALTASDCTGRANGTFSFSRR